MSSNVSGDQLLELLEQDLGAFVICFTRAGCPYCEELYSTLNEVAEEIPVLTVDLYASSERAQYYINKYFTIEYFPTLYLLNHSSLYKYDSDDRRLHRILRWVHQCT